MTETQLIASGRLDKLEDLVEDIREYAGEVFDEEDYTLMSYSIARSMSSLLELEKLAHSLLCSGSIPSMKMGRLRKVRREDLEAYIEAGMERGEHGGV
jgi:hypothetical protein